MSILQTAIENVNPRGAALDEIGRFLLEHGLVAIIRGKDRVDDPMQVVTPPAIAAAPERPAGAVPWEVFEPELLAQYGPRMRSVGTLRAVKYGIKILKELGVTSTSDLTVQLISRVVATRDEKLSPNTVRSNLRAISSIAGHAVAFGYLPVSPFAKRPIRTFVRPSKPKGVRHLTKAQIRAILDVLAQDVRDRQGWALYNARRLQALFVLIAGTGLRLGEALHAHVEDLDLEQGIFWVTSRASHRLKTAGSEKFVIVAAQSIDILRGWLAHRMDAPEGFERKSGPYLFPNIRTATPWINGPTGYKPLCRLQAVAARAGVEAATWHAIRRSVATHMEAAGCGPAQIQRQLRHSNVGTTQNYYMQADQENMKKAMENFGY